MSDNYVGLFCITHNDIDNLRGMLISLEATIDYPTILYFVDLNSTDGSDEALINFANTYNNEYIKDVLVSTQKLNHLPALTVTQNAGFKYLMSRQECSYIGWIHPDMIYGLEWLSELVATLKYHPEIGKICSFNSRDGRPEIDYIFEGQEQAYIIRREILFQIGLFDENFIGIGGREDWDMNNRIRREGLKVAITPKSVVLHKGMATREKRDTVSEQVYNARLYYKKWGTYSEWVEF